MGLHMVRLPAVRRAVGTIATMAIVAISGVQALSAGAGSSAPRWPVCGEWRRVPVPEGGLGSVTDVEVVSPTDAWAISDHGYESWNESHVYHWAGRRWAEVRFPIRPGPARFWVLTAIEAVTASEIWVVGYEFIDERRSRAISARWDGSRWRLVRVGQTARGLAIDGLAVTPGTHRLWAVGSYLYSREGSSQALVLRWSGRRWRPVDTPSPGKSSALADVVTIGKTAWAVGYVKHRGEAARMLASRWTGERWTVRSGPRGRLSAVDGIRRDELWAVGVSPGRSGYGRGLIAGWDGARWSLARRFDRASDLRDIVVTSGTDAWAVGQQGRDARPFVVRRHSGPWAVAAAPDAPGWLTAIDGTPNNLWTFRTHFPGGEPSEVVAFDSYHRC
jgi:hypothetical protein